MPSFPVSTLSIDEVQVCLLALLMIFVGWLAIRSIKHGERLVRLETLLTNHSKHRFDQIAKVLGLTYDDDWPEGK